MDPCSSRGGGSTRLSCTRASTTPGRLLRRAQGSFAIGEAVRLGVRVLPVDDESGANCAAQIPFSTSQEDQQLSTARGTWSAALQGQTTAHARALCRAAGRRAAQVRPQRVPRPARSAAGSIKSRLKHAKKRVESLPLVALTEQFDRSLRLLDATLGLQLQAFTTVHTYTRAATDRSPSDGARREALRRDIRPDLILWRTAVKAEHLWTVQFGESDEKNGKSASAFRCEWSAKRCWDGYRRTTSIQTRRLWCRSGRRQRRTSRCPAARAEEGRDVAGGRGRGRGSGAAGAARGGGSGLSARRRA